jgi:hypothetical protein
MKPLIAGMLLAFVGNWSGVALSQATAPAQVAPASPATPPVFTITLGGRSACVTPTHRGQARAEGGIIDVTSLSSNSVVANLSGSVAANAYLGCSGSATEKFLLVQEFEITCSDKNVKSTKLSLDSVLVGFVRSKHRAGTCMRLAAAKVCPLGSDQSLMVISHPMLCAEGTDSRLCNQHLPTLEVPGVPLGHYVLTAEFLLDAEASGLADAHANADFSPSSTLPADWVRTRDPFQGVDKKTFGFSLTLTASADDAPAASAAKPLTPEVRQASAVMPAQRAGKARQILIDSKGFDRAIQR